MVQIIISLIICVLCIIWNTYTDDISQKVVTLLLSMIFAMILLSGLQSLRPSAMDVYAGKTTLKYGVIDGVRVDSIVVFKDK